jgi:hypothetical protein
MSFHCAGHEAQFVLAQLAMLPSRHSCAMCEASLMESYAMRLEITQ